YSTSGQFLYKLFDLKSPANQVVRRNALHQVALQYLHRSLANDGTGLETGIQRKHDPVEVQHGFRNHCEFAGKPKPTVSGNLRYLEHNLTGVEPAQTGLTMLGHELANTLGEVSLIKTRLRLSHANGYLGCFFAPSFADRQQESQYVVAKT